MVAAARSAVLFGVAILRHEVRANLATLAPAAASGIRRGGVGYLGVVNNNNTRYNGSTGCHNRVTSAVSSLIKTSEVFVLLKLFSYLNC